jgi:two-component system CheB/CheR fusion protein
MEKPDLAADDRTGALRGASALDFPIVGIGASAGGVQALMRFFEHMPPDPGMTFVIVLHLSPSHERQADSIFQRVTSMPVVQVTTSTPIEKNHVYLISPATALSMNDGCLCVTPAQRGHGRAGRNRPVLSQLGRSTWRACHQHCSVGVGQR